MRCLKDNLLIHCNKRYQAYHCSNRSTGFKITHASQYYAERTEARRKHAKLSIGADVLQKIICNSRIKRAPTRHDNIDFRPIITRTSNILPLSVVTADRGYDSEDNHRLVREDLHAFSIIPAGQMDFIIVLSVSQNNYYYYSLSCRTKHKDVAYPRCGSKFKKRLMRKLLCIFCSYCNIYYFY
jgi:hypothetical protein